MSHGFRSHRLGPPLLAALLAAGSVQAQIVTDGSVGPKVNLRGGEIEIGADLGAQRGDNLFHSFEKFGIASGQTATFTGPGDIRNVISRVTGGEVSNIDGALRSEVGQADLYFLNPAGVMFGPNATLDLPGSFHVSTAHELRFADGVSFSALDKTGSGLTVAAPEAFGFLDRPPGRIAVDRSQLQLKSGNSLSLIGGDIQSHAARIETAEGVINLLSVVSAGHAWPLSGKAAEAAMRNSFWLEDRGQIATVGKGGALNIANSFISVSNTGDRHSVAGIALEADVIVLSNSTVGTEAYGVGLNGPVLISAANTLRLDNATVQAQTASAWGGDVTLAVGQLFDLHNSTVTTSVAGGIGGNISVYAVPNINEVIGSTRFVVLNNSAISANAFGGPDGNILIKTDHLMMSSDSVLESSSAISFSGTFNDVVDELPVFSETFLHAGSQLREACAARGGSSFSSFAPGGRGGLPPDPGAPLAASSFVQPLEQQTATGSTTTSTAKPRQAVKPITVAGISQPILGSPRLACRG